MKPDRPHLERSWGHPGTTKASTQTTLSPLSPASPPISATGSRRSPPRNPGAWPRFMSAATAAAYVDETSVRNFLRKVGSTYPAAVWGKGRSARWDKEKIDLIRPAADQTKMTVVDAASVL